MVSCTPSPGEKQVDIDPNTAGSLSLSLNTNSNLGSLAVSSTKSLIFTVRNSGKLTATDLNFVINGKGNMLFTGDAFPGVNGDCTNSLASGESCQVELFVFSNDAHSLNESLVLNYKSGIGPTSVSKSVTGFFGTPAVLEADISFVDFGNVQVTTTKKMIITLKNIGLLPATDIYGETLTTDGEAGTFNFTGDNYPGLNGTCTTVINPGQSCTIEIITSPLSLEYLYSGVADISFKNPTQYQTLSISLSTYGADIKGYIDVSIKDGEFPVFLTALNNSPLVDAPELVYVLTNSGYLPTTNMSFKSSGTMNIVEYQNDCPTSIDPDQSCEIRLRYIPNYSYPLAPGVTFPFAVNDAPVIFQYENSKDIGFNDTAPMLTSGSVIGEGNLFIYQNANKLTPFDSEITTIDKIDRWSDGEFNKIIGTGTVNRNIMFKNGLIGKNVDLKNVTFEMTPSSGYLKLSCIQSNNCPTTLRAGQEITMGLVYNPLTPEETSATPYVLKVSYNDGVKNKTFSIEIPTEATALPFVSLDIAYSATDNAHPIKKSTLLNNQVGGVIVVKNAGLSGINIKDTIVRPSGQNGESYYTFDDSDCDRLIANSETCSLSFTFQKIGDAREKPFPLENFPINFKITNSLNSSDSGYQEFNILYQVSTIERGWYDQTSALNIDYGEVLVSTDDVAPYGEINTYTKSILIPQDFVKGTFNRNNFDFVFVGDEASQFEIVTIEPSVIRTGEEDTNTGNPDRTVSIRYTAPRLGADLGVDGISTAQLQIRYHGQGQTAGSTDFEPEYIAVDLSAKPISLPKYEFVAIPGREPYLPQLYDPTVGTQLLSEVRDVNHTIIKIRNVGLLDNLSGVHTILRTNIPTFSTLDTHYRIRAVDPVNSCFDYYNVNSFQNVEFTIKSMQECEFEIYNYSPDGFGDLAEELVIDWNGANGITSNNEPFKGVGFKFANLRFNPNAGGSINFVKFTDIDLGTSTNLNFTISSSDTSRFVVPGEITSIEKITDESSVAGCGTSLTMPPLWSGYTTIFEPAAFDVVSEACSGISIHPGEGSAPYYFSGYQTSCPLTIKFAPKHIGKAEKGCFKVNFKKFPSESTATGFAVVRVAGAGKIPKAIFKGWREIYAEGETPDDPAYMKIRWNAMDVTDNLGTVVGYKVYRKTLQEGGFNTEPVKEGAIADFYNASCNCYEFNNNTDEVLPDGSLNSGLVINKLYSYKVMALVNFPGEGDFLAPTKVGNVDEVSNILLPAPYHSLIHRWTANMRTCMEYFNKTYADLDRDKDYSCEYNGETNENGNFDVLEHTIVERYETGKRTTDNKPDSSPGLAPYLFESLATAKEYCDGKNYSITDLNIFSRKKILIDRRDYMIGSMGIVSSSCITEGVNQVSGEDRCVSDFGINDMVGNAWDLINDTLLPQTESIWKYPVDTIYENQNYYFSISTLDFQTYIGSDYNTFMDFFKFDSVVQCFNPLLNEPRYSLGGICADAKGEFRMSDLYLDQMSDFSSTKIAVIFPKHEAELGSAFTIKRYLMMGGSSNSKDRFNVGPHNRVMYWTNPDTERILMAQHPKGQYQGGAPRCVVKFSDD